MSQIPSSYIYLVGLLTTVLFAIYGKITHKKFTKVAFIGAVIFGVVGFYLTYLNDITPATKQINYAA